MRTGWQAPRLLRTACAVGVALAGAVACAGDPPARSAGAARHHCGLPDFEQDVLRRVNEFRAAPRRCGGRSFAAAAPLRWSRPLASLATAQAQGLSERNEMSHDDAKGRGPAERATAAGYPWQVFAENVAGHHAGTAEVMASWQASAGHCTNLMNPLVTEVGVACVPGRPGNTYKSYWAMELAKPR